ncbi:MAG: DNRLRE domain-containing protein [Gemmatimonadaceae bacterium]|nr:DNRLRE domain-containing protein [Gemmatimonadaceae bacterium]
MSTLWTIHSASAQVNFADIGDFGADGTPNLNVSNLVKSWNPDFIVTTGDNNYPNGGADTIDSNIGKYYSDYIGSYTGSFGAGSASNRFFPTLGNHDWGNVVNNPAGADPYKAYFSLPGNERYYSYAPAGSPVRFFMIDSDRNEPDSVSSHGVQGQWLKSQMASATEPFKVVVLHHAAYSSSSNHGSHSYMQWPFKQWGATAVLQGHDHNYERLNIAGIPYFVDGIGGHPALYGIGPALPGSQVTYNAKHGAMKVSATAAQMTFQAYDVDGAQIDTFTQSAPTPNPNAVTKSFQEGAASYTGSQDTFVDDSTPTIAYGSETRATVDGSPVRHGLIRFDNILGPGASQIPYGAQIQYANLRIVTGSDSATNDQSPNLFGLHRMIADWNESSTWDSLAGGVNLGTDAAATGDFIVQPEFLSYAMNFDVTSTVQAWANNAIANRGWALFNDNGTDGWRFVTSESSGLANRPALEITYSYIPEPACLTAALILPLVLMRRRKQE